MTAPLRIGVVGCGAIARHVHLPLLHARSDVRLAALADTDYDLLAETVLRFGGAEAYGSLEDLLQAELDAVVVTLPTGLHATAARAVLESGRHLFLEKPLATSVEDGVAVIEAWRRVGTIGAMGFNCRANPLIVELRELLRSGRAGAPTYLRTAFATAPRDLPEWKQRRATGGGALLDLGAHHIDALRYVTGREIVRVRATIRSRHTEHDTAVLELALDDGTAVHGFFSLASVEMEQIEVHGEAARLAVSRFTSWQVDVTDNPGHGGGPVAHALRRAGALRHAGRALRARRAPLREPGYAVLLDRFIDAVRTGTARDLPDLADGFACVAVIDAAERSAATGRAEVPVALESVLQVIQ